MEDVHYVSWRQKLELLRKLPRPKIKVTENDSNFKWFANSNSKVARSLSSNHVTQNGCRNNVNMMAKLKLVRLDPLHHSPSAFDLSLCSGSLDDYCNPLISANDRFDRYMRDLEHREKERENNGRDFSNNYNGSHYLPGSKGGGWQVLPDIKDRPYDYRININLSKITLCCENERRLSR